MNESDKPAEAKRPSSKMRWGVGIAILAVVGVIALMAMGGYAEHVDRISRAQNMEAVSLLRSARTVLTMEFQENNKWPVTLDKIISETSGAHTGSVGITRGGGGTGEIELTATMRTEGVDPRGAGKTILMVSSDGGRNWTCRPGTMPKEHLPYECRTN